MNRQMEFRVLGPLEIVADGRPVRVDAPKQRALLAVLLIHANEVISTDRLLELVWEEEQPSGGLRTLRFHISKLRDALEPGRDQGEEGIIATRSPGYVLEVAPARVDALAFETLLAEAREVRATDPAGAVKLLDESLGLWRGIPYADFTYEEFAHSEILSLNELRLKAMEDRFDVCIELGREGEVIGELQRLVEEHPRREHLRKSLMLALYRSGRQAEALATFQELRSELGEGLGIEPSQELRDLEDKILLQDPSLIADTQPPAADFLRGYALRGRIGEGAHGVVWRAGQPGVGREVAIKAIHPDIANRPGFIRRFEMEAQLVASLEHPHIVSLFDFWRDPDGAYLVMPYLRGGDLDHLLRQGPLRTDSALELIQAIGGALAYAHRRGVIHRDVTPHNVLLDDEGHPYLADFGVATLIGETGPPTSSSPAYLSPEQHAGHVASLQSDVYSLGVLTHAVLTGESPAVGEGLRPVSAYRSDLPAAVDEIVEVATAIDTIERFRDAEALITNLGRALGTGASEVYPVIETRNPYKGLRAFAETDAGDFFGRDLLESELVEAVSHHRLVGVVGPSGCGKSSLVRAGLIPLLRRGVLPGSENWLVADMYPGSQPFSELQAALLRVAVAVPANFAERLAGDAVDRTALLDELLPPGTELLLIVDQFEELFTVTTDEDTRRRFLEAMAQLAGDPLNRVRLVMTLRADFYDRPLEYPEFAEWLRKGLVTIAVPGKDGLVKAVSGPAQRVGLEVEPGLAERITNDVADQIGGLPLLEYALTELFQRRSESRLTLAGYEQTGGVLGALGRRAEDLYNGRDEAGQHAVRQVFLRLVTVEEGSADTRRRIPLTELHGLGLDPDAVQQVLDDYGAHRLLTYDRDPETRAPTVEVAHEALLTRWDRQRTWIDDRRDDLLLHRRLAASLIEWRDSGERPEYLLSGGRLEHFEAFVGESDIALTGEEREFLARSRAFADQLAGRRRRRRRAILAGFAVAAVVATILAVVAFVNQQSAMTQADLAKSRELAASAIGVVSEDPELSLLLALESIEGGEPIEESIVALHEAVQAHRLLTETQLLNDWALLAPSGELFVSGLGNTVSAYEADSGRQLWKVDLAEGVFVDWGYVDGTGSRFLGVGRWGGEEWPPPQGVVGVYSFDVETGDWSVSELDWPCPPEWIVPNGSGWVDLDHLLVVAAEPEDGQCSDSAGSATVLRADLGSGSTEPIVVYTRAETSLMQWATSEDGRLLGLGVRERTSILDLDTGLTEVYGPPAPYHSSTVLNSDGSVVVAVAFDRDEVWNTVNDSRVWSNHETLGWGSASFTAGGSKILIASRLWDLPTGRLLAQFPTDDHLMTISVDGKRAMSTSGVAVQLWNASVQGEIGAVQLPVGGSYQSKTLGVSHDLVGVVRGRGTMFGTLYIASIHSGDVLNTVENTVGAVALSPDGRLVAVQQEPALDSAGTVAIHDALSGEVITEMEGLCVWSNHTGTGPGCQKYPDLPFAAVVRRLEFSLDGTKLIGGLEYFEGFFVVVVWDANTGEALYQSPRETLKGFSVQFPAGDRLLLLQRDQAVILDTQNWAEVGAVSAAFADGRFTADGRHFVGYDDDLILYETETWSEVVRSDPECVVKDYEISPDGSGIAAACLDGRVRVYDLGTLVEQQQIPVADSLTNVEFVADTHLLVTPISGPGLILTVDIDELIDLARSRVTRTFTQAECEIYEIDPCPAEE